MRSVVWFVFGALAISAPASNPDAAEGGDPERGAQLFHACAACHTLEPGEHRTGPSLARIVGREAATVPGFTRYSPALEAADVVWSEDSLDAWLADPQAFLPGNRMTFAGIRDAQARADLIAFPERTEGDPGTQAEEGGGGMMAAARLVDLKALGPDQQVASIRYCGDTYRVTTAAGETFPFWEFNLRFKTDSSDKGPRPGQPVLLPASMMGDRAFVIFAKPKEITPLIEPSC